MTFYTVVLREGDARADKDTARGRALARLLPLLGADAHAAVSHDESGRPFLPDHPEISVSISHAAPFTAVAVSTARVGVDVECVEAVRDPAKLARRFFTEGEQAALADAADPAAVCAVWTRKEALAKYVGTGLADTLSRCTETPPAGGSFQSERFATADRHYVLTLCTDEKAEKIETGN